MKNNNATLRRSLSLPLITFYGLGNILGAGIYVLVGKVAGEAGYFAPLSFLVASIIAAISAFTYAELSARYPVSAGEAVYIYEGFGLQKLALTVGLMISMAGILSAAAIANGFAGYMQVFFDIPGWLAITLILLTLGILAIWGISQSVQLAAFLTIAEIFGLLLIIFVGIEHLPELRPITKDVPSSVNFSLFGIFSGAFLAFYAYLGFEDMVNVAEEVKNPQKTMPRAILLCIIISTLLYTGVTLVAVNVLPPSELAHSAAPLADIYVRATGLEPIVITVIGVFAMVNGILIQLIMPSRLLYGMACRHWIPGFLSTINPATQTPINSTLLTLTLIFCFALVFQIRELAELTSYLVLSVFALVNLALIRIKRKNPAPNSISIMPAWLPKLGFITTTAFLCFKLFT